MWVEMKKRFFSGYVGEYRNGSLNVYRDNNSGEDEFEQAARQGAYEGRRSECN